jgi:hypothetical protein
MRVRCLCLCALFALIAVLGIALPSAAQDSAATVELPGSYLTLNTPQDLTFTLDCGDGWCSAFDITLTFPIDSLRVNAVTLDSYLGTFGQVIFARHTIDNVRGTVRIAAVSLLPMHTTEDSALFTLNVTALQAGSTAIQADSVRVADSSGQPIDAGFSGGGIRVTS